MKSDVIHPAWHIRSFRMTAPVTTIDAALQRCAGYSQLKMYAAAWNELEDLPSELKQNFGVLSWRIQILADMGEHEKASFLGITVVQLHPDRLGVLLLTADCLILIKNYVAARDVLVTGIINLPKEPLLWLRLALVESHLNDHSAVKACVERYVTLNPEGRDDLLDVPELEFLWK